MTISYRGEGHVIQPGCTLQAHYIQLQAVCDALGFAAQSLQARELELQAAKGGDHRPGSVSPLAADNAAKVQPTPAAPPPDPLGCKAEYWYGVFQGLRGLLRAIEGNVGELQPIEIEMLERIRWDLDPPRFMIPGFEAVQDQDDVSQP